MYFHVLCELDAELCEVFARGRQIVSDDRHVLLNVHDDWCDIRTLVTNVLHTLPRHLREQGGKVEYYRLHIRQGTIWEMSCHSYLYNSQYYSDNHQNTFKTLKHLLWTECVHVCLTLLMAVRAGSQAASRSWTNSWMLFEITLTTHESK